MPFLQSLRFAEYVAQASAIPDCPKQQQCTSTEEQRRRPALQNFDAFCAFENDRDLNSPENCERDRNASWHLRPCRPRRLEECVQCQCSDPRLDPEPSTGDDRPQYRRDVGTAHAKARSAKHRERDSVFRSGVCIEDHGNQHDHVAEQDRYHRLPPRHPLVHEAGRKGVGGDHDAHADPERGDVVGGPRPARRIRRREIRIPERAASNVVRPDCGVGSVAGSRCDSRHDARPALVRGSH